MRHSRHPFVGRSLERLEDRAVPAGNVLVVQDGNRLVLTGDALGNSVQILPSGPPNSVVVLGGGTTVNGAAQQFFTGVADFFADMGAGNDRLEARGITVAEPFEHSSVFFDGNTGDDRIELISCTFRTPGSVFLALYGEQVISAFGPGTSGNDTLRAIGTRAQTNGICFMGMYGETVDGGTVTGGNDTIAIDDSVFVSADVLSDVHVDVFGEFVRSLGTQNSRVNGGNDAISVTRTVLSAVDSSGFNGAVLTVLGEWVISIANPGRAVASVGVGNDSIVLDRTTVATAGEEALVNGSSVAVAGDRLSATSTGTGSLARSEVGGGNDLISYLSSTASGEKNLDGNQVVVELTGDEVASDALPGTSATATVGSGNDRIFARNSTVTAAGPGPDVAAFIVRGDALVALGAGVGVVGQGNDTVVLENVQVPGKEIGDTHTITVDTGAGRDRVEVSGSAAGSYAVDLGDGDDTLTFNLNEIGEGALLDGGPGFDVLRAQGNGVQLDWFDFEDVIVLP